MRVFAPAKLNLYLRVVGRRADGFHELETLFERLDLADELVLTDQPRGITLSSDHPTLDCGLENLVVKAAQLLQDITGTAKGVSIRLTKRIPVAAGLGGGSSDGASALLGLNRFWRLGVTLDHLKELGAGLGSDVPFFLDERPFSVGRGRGERCEPVTGRMPQLWHVLVAPPVALSTKDVFAGWDAGQTALTESVPSITMVLHALRNGSLRELAGGLWNDLQPEAIRRCPVIQEIQTHVTRAGCVGAVTSGSGPSVFGLCQDAAHAAQAAQSIRQHGSQEWSVQVVTTWSGSVIANGEAS